MKSNSVIAKNLFNHFSISVLSPFTAAIVPTSESKWKQIMVFGTSYSPTVSTLSLADFNHPPSQGDGECFLLCCHCCLFVLILWQPSASVHLLRTSEHCSWLPPPVLVWGNTISDSSGLLALYFLFCSQFFWEWSFWFHVLCFLNGKVLQLFFCFRQKHVHCLGFTQKILHSFLSFSSSGTSVVQTGGDESCLMSKMDQR